MVTISIENSTASFTVLGLHRLWSFRSRIDVPLAHVADVRHAQPEMLRGWWKGVRLPGTRVPGVLIAGTFYKDGERVFWDVRHPEGAIVVELTDERFARLIIEVANPAAEVARFQAAPLT